MNAQGIGITISLLGIATISGIPTEYTPYVLITVAITVSIVVLGSKLIDKRL